MNPYVSANEKAQLIRVILMRDVLNDAINVYAGLDSTDKAFLTELRHGRTRIEKAVKLRRLALENDADDKLLASASKLEPMFLARPEARKAHKEVLELRNTLPMDIDDMQDWYGFVIESTCKSCTRADYQECPARRILTKYEICPIDPGAKDKCQYSYVGTPEAEELQPVDIDKTVPAIVYNAALAMVRAKEDSISENYVPAIEQLDKELSAAKEQIESLQEKNAQYIERNQELYAEIAEYDRLKMVINDILHPNGDGPVNPSMCDIVAYIRGDFSVFRGQISDLQTRCNELSKQSNNPVVEIEQIEEDQHGDDDAADYNDKKIIHEEDSLPVFLGLNNGNKLEMFLPESMAKNLIAEAQRPRLSRSICARYVNGEFVAIDLQEVVAMRVSGLVDVDYIKPQQLPFAQTQNTQISERGRFRIECYCGAEYFADMYNGFREGRNKARCNECNQDVFIDQQAEVTDPKDGVKAVLLTNRYFVSRDPREKVVVSDDTPPNSRELKTVSDLITIKNIGRDYKDPCQLLG